MTNHEKVKQMSKSELVTFIMLKQWVPPLACFKCRGLVFFDPMRCWRCLSFWLDMNADETVQNEEKVNDCDKAPQGLGRKSGCLHVDEWPEKEVDNNGKSYEYRQKYNAHKEQRKAEDRERTKGGKL